MIVSGRFSVLKILKMEIEVKEAFFINRNGNGAKKLVSFFA